jgi:hypothetical protein
MGLRSMLAIVNLIKKEVVVPYMHARRIIGAAIVIPHFLQQLQRVQRRRTVL